MMAGRIGKTVRTTSLLAINALAIAALAIAPFAWPDPIAAQPVADTLEAAAPAAGTTTRIVVFTPTTTGNTYWPQVHEILRAAAADLEVELLRFEFDVGDRFAMAEEGAAIIRSLPSIDGAIVSVAFGQARPLLDAASARDIPMLVQGPLFAVEREALGGGPRRDYPQWIGTFREDEFGKGYRLARLLIEEAARRSRARGGTHASAAEPLRVAGVGGDPSWQGSERRVDGLRRAVNESDGATLLQVLPTDWTPREGRMAAARLLDRYDSLDVIWAASDQLAIGAADAMIGAGRSVGEDVLIGGLDLSRRGLEEVVGGELSATVASPLFGYAEILIYLYDYIHGFDFAEELGTEIIFGLREATAANAAEILALYEDVTAFDYAALSRARNPARASYRFPWREREAGAR